MNILSFVQKNMVLNITVESDGTALSWEIGGFLTPEGDFTGDAE